MQNVHQNKEALVNQPSKQKAECVPRQRSLSQPTIHPKK